MRTTRFILLFICIAAIFCSCKKKKKKLSIPTVIVVPAVESNVTKIWELVGQTISDPKVNLRARVEGFLEKRNFSQGAFVKRGDLLFQIEKSVYKAQLLQAKGAVDIQKAILKNAKIEYDRKKLLRGKNAISQSELDKATANKDSALGSLEEANAKYDRAKLDLSYTDIKSPIDGRIGLSAVSVGDIVEPATGVLATIVSLNPIYVEFSVTESTFLEATQEAIKNKIPLKKLLSSLDLELVLSNGTTYDKMGKISFWDSHTNASTGTVLLRGKFENPEYILMPGQYVTVKIKSNMKKKYLIIPQAAIQEALGGEFVLVVNKQNIVEYKNIKTGYRFDCNVVVKEGLTAGEQVITQGIQKVRNKMKVISKFDLPTVKNKSKKSTVKIKQKYKIFPLKNSESPDNKKQKKLKTESVEN